ncbi:MAG TPA: PilZ domain-containing protein [Candidatus Cybelea sp.]|nr:PilZ domain-containing protein [Candidatus Cybelea sp.]
METMVEDKTTAGGTASNRRNLARHKTLKSAKIVFNNKQSVIDCFVRDISDTGAKLQVADLVAIPRNFTLMFHDGTSHECERVRAHGLEIGVRFLR